MCRQSGFCACVRKVVRTIRHRWNVGEEKRNFVSRLASDRLIPENSQCIQISIDDCQVQLLCAGQNAWFFMPNRIERITTLRALGWKSLGFGCGFDLRFFFALFFGLQLRLKWPKEPNLFEGLYGSKQATATPTKFYARIWQF